LGELAARLSDKEFVAAAGRLLAGHQSPSAADGEPIPDVESSAGRTDAGSAEAAPIPRTGATAARSFRIDGRALLVVGTLVLVVILVLVMATSSESFDDGATRMAVTRRTLNLTPATRIIIAPVSGIRRPAITAGMTTVTS
jgi:hypothetical protein